MNEEKIVKKLIEHDERFDRLDEKIDSKVSGLRDDINTRLDQILVIVQRLDQERLFTFETVKRMQNDLETQQKDMKRVKQILKIA